MLSLAIEYFSMVHRDVLGFRDTYVYSNLVMAALNGPRLPNEDQRRLNDGKKTCTFKNVVRNTSFRNTKLFFDPSQQIRVTRINFGRDDEYRFNHSRFVVPERKSIWPRFASCCLSAKQSLYIIW